MVTRPWFRSRYRWARQVLFILSHEHKLAQNKCKLHTHQLLPFFLFFFRDAFASLESLLFPPNPYFSSPSYVIDMFESCWAQVNTSIPSANHTRHFQPSSYQEMHKATTCSCFSIVVVIRNNYTVWCMIRNAQMLCSSHFIICTKKAHQLFRFLHGTNDGHMRLNVLFHPRWYRCTTLKLPPHIDDWIFPVP